jgi:hypothetical protein
VLLLAVAGCYYRKYDPLVRTHVDLMLAMAGKRLDLAARGQDVTNTAEFAYPLERARDFARIVGGRFGERASYRAFERFLAAYAEFLGTAAAPETEASALSERLESLRSAAAAVTSALDAERG